jgi:hypothetical protein
MMGYDSTSPIDEQCGPGRLTQDGTAVDRLTGEARKQALKLLAATGQQRMHLKTLRDSWPVTSIRRQCVAFDYHN